MTSVCAFADCGRVVFAKEHCGGHYKQINQGRPLQILKKRGGSAFRDVGKRLMKRRLEVVETGCWQWQGSKNSNGYGQIQVEGRVVTVHRAAYEHWVGPVDAETLHHTCANRLCFNPEHLQPISTRENIAEMRERQYYLQRISTLESKVAELEGVLERLEGVSSDEAHSGALRQSS